MADRSPSGQRIRLLRRELGWRKRTILRRYLGARAEPSEWIALSAYRGLIHQTWRQGPLQPQVVADVWHDGRFQKAQGLPDFFTPFQREREASSHHYGHDIQLKRHAALPLIGPPLPFLLEHGLKVSREAQFDPPRDWSWGGYLCMGKQRATWISEHFACEAQPIGPWISYANCILNPDELQQQRLSLGKTLLVIPAHSWDRVNRSTDLDQCIHAIQKTAHEHAYTQVIWLRHWQDPLHLPLPPGWLHACNGHRSNPWFLDALRTLLEISDGVISNAFGTHLGYAVAMGKQLHWIDCPSVEDHSRLSADEARRAQLEQEERLRLSRELQALLENGGPSDATQRALRALLNPYWGFDCHRGPSELRRMLQSPKRSSRTSRCS
jgi:hypothetical protein